MKTIYIASKLENKDKVRGLANKIEYLGYSCPCKWWDSVINNGGNLEESYFPSKFDLAQWEKNWVANSDSLIFLPPGGRGTHIELGMAFVLDIPVFAVGEIDKPIPFYYLIDKFFDDECNLIDQLKFFGLATKV